MKKVILLLIALLAIPIAFADISITTDQNVYNLGNKIKASASVMNEQNFEGLFKLTMSCGNYKLQYFLTPISLEPNFRTAVNVPEVAVTSSMLGNCTITGDLVTNDNLIVEKKESNSFSVTNQLTVLPIKGKVTALPGDSLHVAGVVNEAFGSNVLKASTKISLDNASYAIDAVDGKFNLSFGLPKNIKSGKHTIEISAVDSKSNSGSASIELEITAVPSYITMALSGDNLLPGSKIDILSSLYDQADDLINASLDLELTSPTGNKIFRKVVQSNEKIEYEFSQYAEPGSYNLISTYSNLTSKSSINITTIREAKVKYENETVLIENVGNIPFEDELTFILESNLKKYPVTKKIKVEAGKTMIIDLSKEVPLGVYDVIVPLKESIEPIKEKISEAIGNIIGTNQENLGNLPEQKSAEKESVLADDVTIHDNRPVYKKIAGGFSSITAAVVGADGVLAKNPLMAPIILIVILLLIVVRYAGKPIMRMFKRKRDNKYNDDGKIKPL